MLVLLRIGDEGASDGASPCPERTLNLILGPLDDGGVVVVVVEVEVDGGWNTKALGLATPDELMVKDMPCMCTSFSLFLFVSPLLVFLFFVLLCLTVLCKSVLVVVGDHGFFGRGVDQSGFQVSVAPGYLVEYGITWYYIHDYM